MTTYETITVEQLPNRVHTACHAGDCGIPDAPKVFALLRQYGADAEWRNVFEADGAEEAEAEMARNIKSDASSNATFGQSKKPEIRKLVDIQVSYKIVNVVAESETVEEVQEEIIPEPVTEPAQEVPETIEVVTVFDSGKGHEVDISESVRATLRTAHGEFTQQQLIDALAAANPDDEDCSDPRELARQVRNALRQFSDRMAATQPICEEIGAGRYVRREVK